DHNARPAFFVDRPHRALPSSPTRRSSDLVDQTFDAGFELDEAAVIGDVGNLADRLGAARIAAADGDPGILAELLEAGADAGALRSEEHTSELQSREKRVCRPVLAKKRER